MSDLRGVAGDSLLERQQTQQRLGIQPNGELSLEATVPYPKTGTAEQQRLWFYKYYPGMSVWLDHSVIGPKLIEAAQKDWSEEQLIGSLKSEEWWRNLTKSQLAWEAVKTQQPGEAERQRQAMQFAVDRMASNFGVRLSEAQRADLVDDAIGFGYSDTEVRNSLLQAARPVEIGGAGSDLYQGTLGANALAVQTLGARYGLRVSEATALDYATQITNLGVEPQFMLTTFAAQAKAKYPWMADLLDQGVIPDQYFEESFAILADELELPRETFKLTDSRWDPYLTTMDKDGKQRASSLTEIRRKAWKDPLWAHTNGATDISTKAAVGLARQLGINL